MKIFKLLILTFLIILSGCKNPLDQSGLGKSTIDNAYNAFLQLPANFSFSSYDMSSAQVILNWGLSERADSYQVKYGTTSGTYSTISSCTRSPCTIAGLTNGTTYYFTVIASNPKGSTSVASELSVTPINAPTVPSGVSLTSANGSASLSWSPSTGTGTIKYKVLRSTTSGSSYSQVATDITTTSYTDSSVTNGTVYYYVVRSFNEYGEGTNSSEVTGTPMSAPAAPTSLAATAGTSQVALSWTASTGSGTKTYTVYRSTTSGSGYSQLATSISSTSYTDSSISVGTTYYYVVKASNLGGASGYSNEVSGQGYQNFSLNIPFSVGTTTSYVFSNSSVSDFTGGVFRLTPSDQTDDDSTSSGFGGATLTGTHYDSTNGYLRLNTTTNNAELDASWTPQWSSLVGYWKLNGSGNVSNGSAITSSVGSVGVATTTNGTSMSYINGMLNQGISTSGSSDSIVFNPGVNSISKYTLSMWFNLAGANSATLFGIGPKTGCGPSTSWLNLSSGGYITLQSGCANAYSYTSTGNQYSSTTWNHIILTFESGLHSIYLNGKLISSGINDLNGAITNLAYVTLGSYYSGGTILGNSAVTIDDVAVWSESALNVSEIQAIYTRQSAKYSGMAQSRVIDAYSAQSWTNLQAITTLPFYKELAPSQESTSSTGGYSGVSSSLNSGLVGLWHLNETSGTTIYDSSSFSNHATAIGDVISNDCTSTGLLVNCKNAKGKFNSGINFIASTSTSHNVAISNSSSLERVQESDSTYSAWIYVNAWPVRSDSTNYKDFDGGILLKPGYHFGLGISINTVYMGTWDTSNNGYFPSTPILLKNWHHVVGVLDKTILSVKIFLDGVLKSSIALPAGYSTRDYGTGWFKIGSATDCASNGFCYPFNGIIDEVSIWNRSLSSSEILQLYRRGANRIKYQVRSCSSSNCSDQDALTSNYKGWKGPDNTGLTYFSELYNTASNSSTGVVQTANPVMTFSNFSGSGLSITNNRYFQYRTILESDDENTLCNYGSGATACSPELKSVTIGPNHYSTSNVSVTSNSGIGSLYQTLSGFTSTLGSNSCSGDRYAISGDGTNFWYYTGAAWALSDGTYAKTSTATQINSNIGTLVAAMGVGTLQVRTYLNSDGITPCEVDNFLIQGQKY